MDRATTSMRATSSASATSGWRRRGVRRVETGAEGRAPSRTATSRAGDGSETKGASIEGWRRDANARAGGRRGETRGRREARRRRERERERTRREWMNV